jgi:nitrite reductase/ring-hydroxylating ferredoxin subunit
MSRHWIPVGLSIDIAPATAAPSIVNSEEFVIWRSASGVVQVWRDRCPHRGLRLSLGFVRGETLACLYHGWRFGADGVCDLIPAHPDLSPPGTICADVLQATEAGGLIWMRAGAPKEVEPPSAMPGETTPVRSVTIDAPADRIWAGLARTGKALAPHLALCPLDSTETHLVVALLPVDATRTTICVLILAERAGLGLRERAADWALRLRHEFEQPPDTPEPAL